MAESNVLSDGAGDGDFGRLGTSANNALVGGGGVPGALVVAGGGGDGGGGGPGGGTPKPASASASLANVFTEGSFGGASVLLPAPVHVRACVERLRGGGTIRGTGAFTCISRTCLYPLVFGWLRWRGG